MKIINQKITERYAIYNGDCCEVIQGLPESSVHLSIYSPPFAGLYIYSSDARDMSNSISYDEFRDHYMFLIKQIARVTMPGRISAVHCMDIPTGNTGCDTLIDFPGDVIRWHKEAGFDYCARYHIWKEPLMVRNRTMMKSLAHKQLCKDSTKVSVANADYLLMFRRKGENLIPVDHPTGLHSYAGEREIPHELRCLKGFDGDQKKNSYSHWIWRQYASCFWDDIRIDRVLPYREGKEEDDEKHCHPLQLDVIERACVLWSNPEETVLTPFMGVGSEVYGAIINGRRAIGAELKTSYYNQALRNVEAANYTAADPDAQMSIFDPS